MGSRRHRDRGGVARRGGDPEPARAGSDGDEPRRGLRDRQQLRHRRGRVRRSPGARDPPRHAGALLGRRLGRAVHGRRADLPASRAAGRPGIGQLGPRRHRTRDRVRRHLVPDRSRRSSSSVWCSPTSSSWAWPMSVPAWSTSWAPRSSAPGSWGATAWRRSSAREGWARSGEPGIACWHGLPPSS